MWTEPKQMPFNQKDVINELGNYDSALVDYRSCSVGGKHKYYHIEIGAESFQDNGKYSDCNSYSFAQDCQKVFKSIEQDLLKQNIVFIREKVYMPNGYDSCWRCAKTDEIEVVTKIVRIEPSSYFKELQEWLKKHANFNLKVTDMFGCNICQKRNDKWYSNFTYYAMRDSYCKRMLDGIKATYKRGNKVVAELIVSEEMDYEPNRYEYEQYGYKTSQLHVTISTPTGRNAIKIK